MKILSREKSSFAANSEVLFVEATNIEQTYRITITRPMSARQQVGAPHGFLALDGDLLSTAAPGIINALSMGNVIPQQVVVTVGYPLDSKILWNNLRVRDLTPVSNPEYSAFQARLLGNECPDGGGASAFLSFLNQQLKPFVEQECGVAQHEWTLFGASFGGLFSTYALMTDTPQFKRYNIVNPSVWFRRPHMQNLARQFAEDRTPVAAQAMFSAGGMETREQQAHHFRHLAKEELALIGGIPDMMLDMMEIAALLRNRPGLRLTTLAVPNEDHFSVLGSSLTQGMRWLYSTPPES